MNSMSNKVNRAKAKLKDEREEAARQEYLNSLTDEERVAYLTEEKERQEHAARMMSSLLSFGAVLPWYNK